MRHELTAYEAELAAVAGRVGVHEAYAEIKRLVYGAIGVAYPWLASEARRQLAQKTE